VFQARKTYLGNIRKVVTLQSFFRMAISRNHYRRQLELRAMSRAATVFQKLWRARVARKHFEKLKLEQQVQRNSSAIIIQKNWKMMKQMKKYKKDRELIIRLVTFIFYV
jgi:hypothetical protein